MRYFGVLTWLWLCGSASAVEWSIVPAEITLAGKDSSQRVWLFPSHADRVIQPPRDGVSWMVADPKIAIVQDNKIIATGSGQTEVTTVVDGQIIHAKLTVLGGEKPPAVGFRNHVQPILTRTGCNSGSCHGALAGKGGLKLSLRGYDSDADHFALTRQASARRTDREHPEKSLLLLKATRKLPHGGGTRFEADTREYRILHDWIAAGLASPKDAEPVLTRLELLPSAALLKPGMELPLVVRAWHADGHAEDVTDWAKFSSSDDPTATVSEEGRVRIAGHGEAAISAAFGNRIVTMSVRVPFPNDVPAVIYEKAPSANFIDAPIYEKLRALNLAPSEVCDDATFFRRIHLDAAGILPTPEDLTAFLADKSPQKRAKAIDRLLERPEYVDYWAYKWSDLLLVSTRKLPQPAMWAFYRSVRQAVSDNKPWDRFARDLLTVTGSSLQNGAGNYFVLHKEVPDLTEATAVTFLGMSITCARCHNHPLEKWTQDEYWQMANLFSRVGLKNGDRPGDIMLAERSEGDVLHPRRNIAMPPTPLDGKPWTEASGINRRAYFAAWLTSAENPYFAKALVNRVWKNFMGRALVEPEDDLRETNPPTNAELFNALCDQFRKDGYDVKSLIRHIMNSAAYQRSSKPVLANKDDDRFYSRYLVRRLSGEVMLDALSTVTAAPTAFTKVYSGVEGGTQETTNYPMGTRAMQLPDSRVASRFLDAFGRPDRSASCSCERQSDSTVGQALLFNNGDLLNDKLRAPDSRLNLWLKENISDAEAVRRVFTLALSRSPNDAELKRLTAGLAETKADRKQAFEDLFWAVLTNREFLFNH